MNGDIFISFGNSTLFISSTIFRFIFGLS